MGLTDRIIRSIAGILIVILFITKVITGVWAIILLILAGLFLIKSAIGYCPPYSLFGWNTNCKHNKDSAKN